MEVMELFTRQYGLKDPQTVEALCRLTQIRQIPRGTVFLEGGKIPTEMFLLISGVARGYFVDREGTEHTDCFCFRCGTPTMPPSAFDEPSPVSIVAVTDCEFAVLPLQSVMPLVRQYGELTELYTRLLMDAMRMHNHTRHVICNLPARQRFEWFLEEYPGLVFDVNNRHVASFLNMTPETLSRMKSALRKERNAEWREV